MSSLQDKLLKTNPAYHIDHKDYQIIQLTAFAEVALSAL